MDYQYAKATSDLEVNDKVLLKDGTHDVIDKIRFIQEIMKPDGVLQGLAWFEFHLLNTDKWVRRAMIEKRII